MATISRTQSVQFAAPDRLAQPGDKYVVDRSFRTAARVNYHPGDVFEIIERTDEAPHGYSSSLGNIRAKCKQGISVWSSIDDCIANGMLKLQIAAAEVASA